MYTRVFRVNASFGVILSVNFTLDLEFKELSFLRFGEEEERGFCSGSKGWSFCYKISDWSFCCESSDYSYFLALFLSPLFV
jgi:hypothetical protein